MGELRHEVVPASDRRSSERRAAGRRSMQAILRQIVERLADGIVIVSADGRIQFANPAAQALFGRAAAELVGQEFGYTVSTGEAAEIEIVRRGHGAIVAELRTVETVWEDEPATLVSIRDITDRRLAEEHRRQLEKEQAARAEAEAASHAKSEFLAVMSHELRTPLNAVLGYAELLDLGVVGSLTPEQRQQVGRITASGRHLLGLVNEILDLAKVEAGRLSVERVPTSAAEVVEAAVVLTQPLAEPKGITLHVPLDIPRSVHFQGDRDRTLQVLANLLSNAVKFTEPGGQIRIRVEHRDNPGEVRHLHGTGPWVTISITDTGIGIAEDQLEAIFSPFVQAEAGHTRRSDGTGLGLTISRRLARLMRGDVTVRSLPGEGSTFTLWLPVAVAGEADDADDASAADAAPVSSADAAPSHGLAEAGDVLLHELEPILDAYVARLRNEPMLPAAATLRYSQLADHMATLIADVATSLLAIDDSAGAPSSLLVDSTDIQRLIADRHGLQRARLGWTQDALARDCAIFAEEVERALRRCLSGPARSRQASEAIRVVRRYLEQSADSSRRALARAQLAARVRPDR